MTTNKKPLPADWLGDKLRGVMVRKNDESVLISYIPGSTQEGDVRVVNCGGYGRLWHKPIISEVNWVEFVWPYYPASWKLGISINEVDTAQVFQIAGCNFRCWYCYVDYSLLNGNLRRSQYITCSSLIDFLKQEAFTPKIIRLTGGQPDLVPEWTPWMMKALRGAGLDACTYLWVDDNLSNDFAWRFLDHEDWRLICEYQNFGRVGCLKGYDPESFHFNTRAPAELFALQLDILRRWVSEGVDIYVYLVLTTANPDSAEAKINHLLDALQNIHPKLPLRVCPIKINRHTPNLPRINDLRKLAIDLHQYTILDVWRKALAARFPTEWLANYPTQEICTLG